MTTKEYLIKIQYDQAAAKAFENDMAQMKEAAKNAGTAISSSAQVISHSVENMTIGTGKNIQDATRHILQMVQDGKTLSSSWVVVAGEVKKGSVSFTQTTKALADFIPVSAQVTRSLETVSKAMASVTAANISMQKLGAKTPVESIVSTKASVKQVTESTIGGPDTIVPMQKFEQVLRSVDGTYQKLTTTITRHSNGTNETKRQYTDYTATMQRLERIEALRAERLEKLAQKERDAAGASAANAKALLEQKAATDAAAASLGKLILTETQAEAEARKLATGLSANAKVIGISQNESLVKGIPTNKITAAFDQGNGRQQIVTLNQTAAGIQKVSEANKELADTTGKAGINIGQLVSRAALTIPVWYALRSAVMGFLFGIRDGVANILSFDAAMQKLRGNLDGTSAETAATLGTLKNQFTELSKTTGVSVNDIANSFQKFATVGFGVQESMTGAVGSVKLATAFMGDSTETANAFARALRVLVDQSHGTASSQAQMSQAMNLTAELWQKNAFEVSEMNQGLEKFAAQANVSKLSMKEVLVLLASMGTAAVGGARGGTLLRTSLADLAIHAKDVAGQIGVQLNPALDTNYTALHKVVDALAKMNEQDRLNIETTGALSKIFGGVRGSLPIEALIAMNKLWKENEQLTGDASFLNNRVQDTLESESGQAKILGNQINLLTREWIQSALGADDFTSALKTLNSAAEATGKAINLLIIGTRNFFTEMTTSGPFGVLAADLKDAINLSDKEAQKGFQKIISGIKGELSKADLKQLTLDFKSGKIAVDGINKDAVSKALDRALAGNISTKSGTEVKVNAKLGSQPEAIRSFDNELNELKARLKANGATDIELQILDVQFQKSQAINDATKIRDEQSKIRVATIEKERSIQDTLLSAVEAGAKAEGATTLEVLNRRIEMENDLGIKRTGLDLLNQQLALQQALTEETKKTKKERLDELQALVKKTLTPEQQVLVNERDKSREQVLREQATAKGISKAQQDSILNPEKSISRGNSLLQDLQSGLSQPMTRSMGSLETAIISLTNTIMAQETKPLQTSLPKFNPISLNNNSANEIAKPGSAQNRAVNQVMDNK